MDIILFGLIGLILIVIAWIPETIDTIKSKKCDLNLWFVIAYCVGSILLIVYSVLIKNIIFVILNGLASLEALINLNYKLRK